MAQRLTRRTRANDTVARLGDDEYAMVVNGLEAANEAALTALEIMEALNVGFQLEHTEIHVSASIGITVIGRSQSVEITDELSAGIGSHREFMNSGNVEEAFSEFVLPISRFTGVFAS